MIPLVYVGVIAFGASFISAYSITRELLKFRFDIDFFKEPLLSNIISKVKFKKNITIKYIPNRYTLSPNTINKLWYNNKDYKEFVEEYKRIEEFKKRNQYQKKYNSI